MSNFNTKAFPMTESKIIWKDEYNIGIDSVDHQHKKIIESIQILRDGIITKEKNIALAQVFKDLQNYGIEHFGHEEQLMKESHYPHLESHIKIHQKFITDIEKMNKEFQTQDYVLLTDIIVFLKNWFIDHILKEDKKFANFVTDKKYY